MKKLNIYLSIGLLLYAIPLVGFSLPSLSEIAQVGQGPNTLLEQLMRPSQTQETLMAMDRSFQVLLLGPEIVLV